MVWLADKHMRFFCWAGNAALDCRCVVLGGIGSEAMAHAHKCLRMCACACACVCMCFSVSLRACERPMATVSWPLLVHEQESHRPCFSHSCCLCFCRAAQKAEDRSQRRAGGLRGAF